MALSRLRWILLLVLVISATYFIVFHRDPLPANHEAVGFGDLHIAHDIIGVALLVTAGYVWWSARRRPAVVRGP